MQDCLSHTIICASWRRNYIIFISLYNFPSEIAVFSYGLTFLVKFSEAINSYRKKM